MISLFFLDIIFHYISISGEVIPINTGVKKTTLGEEEVEFVVSVKGGDSTVKVVTPNIYARNGVIHVIDTVIL